ncbi:hypothetical protein C0583_00315 [Candidatus Parcubacteria bacterium]|nr:MAG: hypothetical protein C0583_00315 [Candidatus Parcubacteria bacterium]
METKTYNMKSHAKYRFVIGGLSLLSGIILLITNPGLTLGNIMIPNTLVTLGIILIAFGFRGYFFVKEIKYDERTQIIALRSSKAVLLIIIYAAMIAMLAGTVQKIQVDLATASAIILFGTIISHKLFHIYYDKRN